MNTRHPLLVFVSITLLLAAVPSYASGPLLLRAPGAPCRWPDGGRMIPWNPDRGGLGPLSSAQAVAQTADAFKAWADIPTASATHVNTGFLPDDVDETNFLPYFFPEAPDGLNAIVYDEDGAIFDLLFGPGAGVLGFAGPEWIDSTTGQIVEGQAFMNGGELLGPIPFPIAEMLSVQVHEFGHYQNLAHTVVNGTIPIGDQSGPSPFDTFPPESLVNRIETMYPFLYVDGGMATPHADDVASLSTLYPEPAFVTGTGTITGTIVAPNNTSRLTGVNVIARNVASPYDDAVSAISSDYTDDFSIGAPLVGVYTLRGLTPGASYAIYVDRILEGGFSTPPRLLPGPEEFYNGAAESNDMATDLPNVFTPVVAAAGVTVPGVDIIFNRLPPGPIPAGNDTSFEIFPAFVFDFCGQRHESVFVNSNGNLTFGTGNLDFSETTAELLTGPPRIAALWDDLNAAAAPGSIGYSESPDSITFSFTNVPEFGASTSNTFSITLYRHGHAAAGSGSAGQFSINYGSVAASDGAAGYSCGGRLTSGFEKEADLSAARPAPLGDVHDAAVFEVFGAGDNDLDNRQFRFVSPRHFVDDFEPDHPAAEGEAVVGPTVALPFHTANHFTSVGPGDVDFYRFHARAGDIVAIETVPGLTALDTVLGIFDAGGTLLAANDDSGAGLLSRILVQVAVDGVYRVGVSTFPDLGFTGDGEDAGRYVLNISRYRGTILDFGDDPLADPSVEVGLATFAFPFQGTNWSSMFVNDNGNVTFGAASGDFSETVLELRAGPPRIAPLWDDLNVVNGLVIAEENDGELQIHFVSVPEFLATGTNYFTVKLDRTGNIAIDYGAINRSDGIVGVSEGGGAADPGPTDLIRELRLSASGTTYEQFAGVSFATYGGADLAFTEIRFRPPR